MKNCLFTILIIFLFACSSEKEQVLGELVVYKKYYNKQQEICNQFDLCPSDSVWLATSLSDKYRDFIRADIARLCLTSLIDENLQ